jgi:hypothetical protein
LAAGLDSTAAGVAVLLARRGLARALMESAAPPPPRSLGERPSGTMRRYQA